MKLRDDYIHVPSAMRLGLRALEHAHVCPVTTATKGKKNASARL